MTKRDNYEAMPAAMEGERRENNIERKKKK